MIRYAEVNSRGKMVALNLDCDVNDLVELMAWFYERTCPWKI